MTASGNNRSEQSPQEKTSGSGESPRPAGLLCECTVAELVVRCQQAQDCHNPNELLRIAPGAGVSAPTEDGACFELLRRGLEENDSAAWLAFEAQFQPLFYRWLQQDLSYFGCQSEYVELEDLWAEARSRFVTRYARLQRLSENFQHIGAVLKVLQKCIRSSVQELRRQQERQQRLLAAIQQVPFTTSSDLHLPATQVEIEELRRCITHQLHLDVPETELRELLVLRYVENLKPREICHQYPEQYPDATDVHKALERVMKRLRRRVEQYISRCL